MITHTHTIHCHLKLSETADVGNGRFYLLPLQRECLSELWHDGFVDKRCYCAPSCLIPGDDIIAEGYRVVGNPSGTAPIDIVK